MTRITVEIDDGLLHGAQRVLGTKTKVATINEALRLQALRAQAADIIGALDSVEMDFAGSGDSFRYAGGRDLAATEERAGAPRVA